MKEARMMGKDGRRHNYRVYGTLAGMVYVPVARKTEVPPPEEAQNPVWGSWEVHSGPGTYSVVPGWWDAPKDYSRV